MSTTIERKCPKCYYSLPDPECELSYFLWNPGFEYKVEVDDSENKQNINIQDEGPTDEDMAEALAEMVEEDEMKAQFQSVASRGCINSEKAAMLARKLGLAPSDEDVRKIQEEFNNELNYQQFQKFLAQCTHPEDNVENMTSFFAHFDITGCGYLSKNQVYNLLTSYGETLTNQEFDSFVKEFAIGDKVDYRQLCERILQKK